jgi:cytochrome c-type protein NapB
MKRQLLLSLASFFLVVVSIYFVGCASTYEGTQSSKQEKAISDKELGLRKTDVTEEKSVNLPPVKYTEEAPGSGKLLPTSYPTAPPQIPHSVEGFVPITKDNNSCLGCHAPDVAKDMGAVPIPESHYIDPITGKKLDHLAGARYMCTTCHTPQANAKPLVQNTFKPAK